LGTDSSSTTTGAPARVGSKAPMTSSPGSPRCSDAILEPITHFEIATTTHAALVEFPREELSGEHVPGIA